jgi:hypothetical protein
MSGLRPSTQGHPAGAVNIPLIDRDPRSGQMMPNPDFMQIMQANYPVDTKLLIGCQVGGRSMRAQMLEALDSAMTNVKAALAGCAITRAGPSIRLGRTGLPVETDAPPELRRATKHLPPYRYRYLNRPRRVRPNRRP